MWKKHTTQNAQHDHGDKTHKQIQEIHGETAPQEMKKRSEDEEIHGETAHQEVNEHSSTKRSSSSQTRRVSL